MVAPPSVDPNRTIMGTAPTVNATQTIKPVQCPVCKTFNPVGVMFCVSCGLIFEKALPGDAFGAPAVQLPVLVDDQGREYTLRPGENVIGRQGDLIIEDARVSRRHARLVLDGTQAKVDDLGSTNGTKVAGEPVVGEIGRPIAEGEVISLGGFELTLRWPGEQARTAMPSGGRTAALEAPPMAAAQAVAWLVGNGQRWPLKSGVNTFGRKTENDVCLPDPFISGKHGTLEVDAGGIWLTDIGSTNGTLLNGAKLAPQTRTSLLPGDVIRLGQFELHVEREAS